MKIHRQIRRSLFPSLVFSGMLIGTLSGFAITPTHVDTAELRAMVSGYDIMHHLDAFQRISDTNGGNRAAGTLGYEESANYIIDRMSEAGYQVHMQDFDFWLFHRVSQYFAQTWPVAREFELLNVFTWEGDYWVFIFSGSGMVEDTYVVPTNDVIIPAPEEANTSTSGCESEDFLDTQGNSLVEGAVALIQRGTCTFRLKAQNAEAAGAVAALIFNEGQVDLGRAECLLAH